MREIRKIFLLGDLHLGIKNNSVEWSDIQSEYLLGQFMTRVDDCGFDPESDILIQVGDWHHIRESTNNRVYKCSIDVAREFSKKFKRGVYVILGNHDVYYKDRTDVHSLEGIDLMFSNFHVVTRPKIFRVGQQGHTFLLQPWVDDIHLLRESISSHTADYLICHADVRGSVLSKFTKLEHGLEIADLIPFQRVYSGHIHIRQEIGNVLYVGTPYEMDRGDRGNTKGFYVLDVSGESVSETFIENTISPKHVRLDAVDVLNMNRSDLGQVFRNSWVDITIEAELSSRFPFSRFTDLISGLGHRRLEFFTYTKAIQRPTVDLELDSNYEYNIFKALESRLAELTVPDPDKETIRRRFKEIYDRVSSTKRYDQ